VFEYAAEELRLLGRGTTLLDRARLTAMSARLHLAARGHGGLVPRSHGVLRLSLDGGRFDLSLRANDFVLFEVFGFGAYDVDLAPLGPVRTVLDVGANIGLASVFLADRLPDARFICVEPSADSFRLLERNLRQNVPRADAIHAAVAAEPGRLAVEEGVHPGHTRTTHAAVAGAATVPALTLTGVLDHVGVPRADLLKLDIEGGEIPLLATAERWAHRVGAVLAEIHAPLTKAEALDQLAEHGFRPVPLPRRPQFADILLAVRPQPGPACGR